MEVEFLWLVDISLPNLYFTESDYLFGSPAGLCLLFF